SSSRSVTTHWSPALYVGFGPVFHQCLPKLAGTASCGVVVSIGCRSSAPRALRTFLAKLLNRLILFPLNSCTSALRLVVCSVVRSVFRHPLIVSIDDASATAVVLSAWQSTVGL